MSPSEYEVLISSIAQVFTNNPLEIKDWVKGFGKKNLIKGFSKYAHQIDVSLECETDIILIECKLWKNPINVSDYLVLLGRVEDIAKSNPKKRVRGALVTTKGWRSCVIALNSTYDNYCSIFNVNTVGEILERIHKAFIKGHISWTTNVNGTLRKK
jgi:hypothetical protein